MQKRKNEGLLDDSYLTVKYFDGPSKFEGTREERHKVLAELEAKRARKIGPTTMPSMESNSNHFNNANQIVIPLHSDNSEDMPAPANKIIVVRRPVTTLSSSENIQQGSVVSSNYQSSLTSGNSLPTFANRSLNQSANRSILVSSSQSSVVSGNFVAVSSDRPIGAMTQLNSSIRSVPSQIQPDRSIGSMSQLNSSIRSVPAQIQPNLLINSVTGLKPGTLLPSNSIRPQNTSMNRPIITMAPRPSINRVLTNHQIPTSKGLLTFTSTQRMSSPSPARIVVASNSTSNSRPTTALASNIGKALPASSVGPSPSSIQVGRLQSQPLRVSGPPQSRSSKVPSPEIIEILDDTQVFSTPRNNVKQEESFEIEGALDFEL